MAAPGPAADPGPEGRSRRIAPGAAEGDGLRFGSITASTMLHAGTIALACLLASSSGASHPPRVSWVRIHDPAAEPVIVMPAPELEPLPTSEPPTSSAPLSESFEEPEPLEEAEPLEPPEPFEVADPPDLPPRFLDAWLAPTEWTARVVPLPEPEPVAPPLPDVAEDVDAIALTDHNDPPPYPYVAWARHQQGVVLVELEIDAAGAVTSSRVVQSSGWTLLDAAAREKLLEWRFEPARRNGVARASRFRQPVVFRIRD
jgi:protein TonB